MGVFARTVQRNLKLLEDCKLIKRIGPDKEGIGNSWVDEVNMVLIQQTRKNANIYPFRASTLALT